MTAYERAKQICDAMRARPITRDDEFWELLTHHIALAILDAEIASVNALSKRIMEIH